MTGVSERQAGLDTRDAGQNTLVLPPPGQPG